MHKKFHESVSRSLVKSLTFRAFVICSDLVIVYTITHRADATIGLVILTNCSSTIVYFIHERLWNGIHWGKIHKKK